MIDDSSGFAAWQAEAATELASLQAGDGGWAYIPGQTSATEPTALAFLALATTGAADFRPSAAADALAARQSDDGLFTPSSLVDETGWTTPLAGLALLYAGRTASSDAAGQALLAEPVYILTPTPSRSIYGYDTTLKGWAFAPNDASLDEPTCTAMIFLKKAGYRDHSRVREAAAMLRDRAVVGGGWNYGEPQVLNGNLFPAVAYTAMTLAALADEQDDLTAAGLAWLQTRQGTITSLPSLGWAAIAMNALGLLDDTWRSNVISTWRAAPSARRGPMETALCLLGLTDAGNHPLKVIS